jgi:hypothetical protein
MRTIHWGDYDDEAVDECSSSEGSVSGHDNTGADADTTLLDGTNLEDGHPHDMRSRGSRTQTGAGGPEDKPPGTHPTLHQSDSRRNIKHSPGTVPGQMYTIPKGAPTKVSQSDDEGQEYSTTELATKKARTSPSMGHDISNAGYKPANQPQGATVWPGSLCYQYKLVAEVGEQGEKLAAAYIAKWTS